MQLRIGRFVLALKESDYIFSGLCQGFTFLPFRPITREPAPP
jgi:hypothetical protein